MISASPGKTFLGVLAGAAANLGIAVKMAVKSLDGTIVTANTNASEVVIDGTHTGVYIVSSVSEATPGQYLVSWIDGSGNDPYLDDLYVGPLLASEDATYAVAGQTFQAQIQGIATGLAGTLRISILSDATTIAFEPTSAVISEDSTAGNYTASSIVAPNIAGSYVIIWFDGTSYYADPLVVAASIPPVSI